MEIKKMDYERYFKERLEGQIKWYSTKSRLYKRIYFTLSITEIAAASSIPFLVSYITEKNPEFKILVGILGIIISIITGLIALLKCQELWIEYRITCESLKHERYLFETRTKPYDQEDAFHLFVENVEELISKEHSKWRQYTTEKKKEGEEEAPKPHESDKTDAGDDATSKSTQQ
jgi:hypothetical protein